MKARDTVIEGAGNLARALRRKFPAYDFTVSAIVVLDWEAGDEPGLGTSVHFRVLAQVPTDGGKRFTQVEIDGASGDAVLELANTRLGRRRVEREAMRDR